MFVDFTRWHPWAEEYRSEAKAIQMAHALILFKKGVRVIKVANKYHVLYWDGEYVGPECLCGDDNCNDIGGPNEPE